MTAPGASYWNSITRSCATNSSAGSGLEFEDRGEQQLKGISEPWHLFSARR